MLKVKARSGSGFEEVVVMMLWYGGHVVFWQVVLMWVGMIAFWGLIAWAIYALVTNVARRPENEHRADDARRILDERLARGEIDTEEYRRLREVLAHDEHTVVGTGSGR